MKRALVTMLFLAVAAAAQAHLGDTLDGIEKRMKRKPDDRPQGNAAVWYFEVQDGRIAYIVFFNEKGQSISEKLMPTKVAVFDSGTAQSFIRMQLEAIPQSKSVQVIAPGVKYNFGGKTFVCGARQYVLLDMPNQFLLVWTQDGVPSVIAVRPEALAGR